jgi:N-dimethylarginine dimethylaminohydrolase
MSKINSHNEWDQLKKVVVGIADYAQIPKLDPSLRTVNYANVSDESEIPFGPYPVQVIEEANEDLDVFVNFLEGEGVEVVRPKKEPVKYYNYCPRDTVTILGNTAIAAPMSLQCRHQEYISYADHLSDIIELPNYLGDDIYNYDCVGNPDVLALRETHPKFDAANIIRANDDLLYLVSNSGNKKGSEHLTSMGYNVHLLEGVYSYMHIDSTVAFLREGLMLLNPSRIKDVSVLPKPFRDWDYIMCPEPHDIGHYPGYCNASAWINMNLFSVNPNLVALEENQHSLRIELEKHGIECAMLPTRHQRTLGGGFHCVTLDILRNHNG